MIDAHIHIGWFVDRYHSPDDVSVMLRSVGVDGIVVSSTSTCAEEYDTVLHEMEWLQEEWKNRVCPLLWVTPMMIKTGVLAKMVNSSVNWGGIKMHWQAHPHFYHDPSITRSILANRYLSQLPILLHTGDFPECHASVFERIISEYPERNFILAHGRPIDETIHLLQTHNNVYVDTAFMKIEHIAQLTNKNLVGKVLWGSDCPINEHFYKDLTTPDYLSSRVKQLKSLVDAETFTQITETNIITAYRYE